MRNALKLAVIAIVLAAGLLSLFWRKARSLEAMETEIAADIPEVAQIGRAELARQIAGPDRPLLLDARSREEFQISHLPGAEWIGEGGLTRQSIQRFGTNRPAVVYCSVGYRASTVARNLRRAGWTNVAVLRGSIFRWAIEHRPLESNGVPTRAVHPYNATYASLLPAEAGAGLPWTDLWANQLPPLERWRLGLGIGLLLLFLTWETLAPAYPFFGRGRERLVHGGRNYTIGLINVVLAGLIFVHLWLLVAKWAETRQFGVFHWLGLPSWTRVLLAVLLLDFWTYWWHRMNHQFGFLWRFHRTHHSEKSLDITSAVRFHFGEMSLSAVLRLPIIALLGLRFEELVIYEAILFSIVQFHHANIRLPAQVERVLGKMIVTPSFHRVHHSPERAVADSNYASILPVWDRIFRTRSSSPPPERFGIEGFEAPSHHTVVGLVETPLD